MVSESNDSSTARYTSDFEARVLKASWFLHVFAGTQGGKESRMIRMYRFSVRLQFPGSTWTGDEMVTDLAKLPRTCTKVE